MNDNKYGYSYGGSPFAPRGSGGYPQPFGQPPRPAYPPQPRQNPAQSPQKPAAETLLDGTQILTGEGFKPLSRKEREEAARIAAEAGFSFEGYQVVRRDFYHEISERLAHAGSPPFVVLCKIWHLTKRQKTFILCINKKEEVLPCKCS